MSYRTLEVEIDHGKVVTKGTDKLPETGHGLLMILEPDETATPTPLRALDALQGHLKLNPNQAAEWMATVHVARR
jgi:hypothetical protein